MNDLISRKQAIEALKNDMVSLDHIIKGMSANDVRLDAYVSQRNQVNYDIYTINNLPPALSTNLAEVGTDLISRQAAIDAINCDITITGRQNAGLVAATIGAFVDRIKALPSAQPEIIRCKDCKHWDTTWQNDYAPNYHYCPMIDSTRRNDFYCADAERRTDG